jgi:hypothetical protein
VISLGSSVDLFTSPSAANAYVTKGLADATRFAGKDVESGLHIEKVSLTAVRGLGDRGAAITSSIRLGDTRLHDVSVGFHVGSVFASVDVTRADAKPALDDAVRLAQQLARRIRLAESGALREQPVAVPGTAKQGRPPRGEPALAAMALAPGDLPAGARVERQGYVAADDAIGRYERKFATLRIGTAIVAGLQSDALLLRTAREAKGYFRQVSLLFASHALRGLYVGQLGPSTTVELQRKLGLGDDAFAVAIRARSQGHEVRLVQVLVRVGRVFGFVTAAGPAAAMQLDDVQPLAAKFVRRIRNGL